ncbi:MAG: DUF4391 domain-containing protein [Caldisericia bacterium]|nr:DUF4391 domain-containing protein [Caldisericia bacterium]
MLNFPKSTEFNKKIPKQKFYNNLKISSKIERQFTKELESIYWKNKLSSKTLNVSPGSEVKEIEIIEINLKEKSISKNILELIDREIPYHIVFLLRFKELAKICLSYKENSQSRKNKFKISNYFKTDWLEYKDICIDINGLNLDKIYENFIIQISNGAVKLEDDKGIKDAVLDVKEREKLELRASQIKNKIKNEQQFNIQVKLNQKLRKIEEELSLKNNN